MGFPKGGLTPVCMWITLVQQLPRRTIKLEAEHSFSSVPYTVYLNPGLFLLNAFSYTFWSKSSCSILHSRHRDYQEHFIQSFHHPIILTSLSRSLKRPRSIRGPRSIPGVPQRSYYAILKLNKCYIPKTKPTKFQLSRSIVVIYWHYYGHFLIYLLWKLQYLLRNPLSLANGW